MIATSTLTKKNQTTVPKAVLAKLGAKPADQLVYEFRGTEIVLHAKTGRLIDLAGAFAHFGRPRRRPMSHAAMKAAIAGAVAADDLRIRRGK